MMGLPCSLVERTRVNLAVIPDWLGQKACIMVPKPVLRRWWMAARSEQQIRLPDCQSPTQLVCFAA